MTDVRLTALNPTDSQVYPVACNTSGELLVAGDGTDYLPLTGGDLTGDLTLGTDKVVLDASSGSITAAGAGTFSGELTTKSRLLIENGANSKYASFYGGTGTIEFRNDGSGEMDGSLTANELFADSKIQVGGNPNGGNADGFRADSVGGTKFSRTNGASPVIECYTTGDPEVKASITAAGVATFAGAVANGTFNTASASSAGHTLSAGGGVYSQCAGTGGASRPNFTGLYGTSVTVSILANGSATFSGTVTATVVPPSDARFKENIAPAKPQLSDVVALGGILKNYNWNSEAPVNDEIRAQRQLGLIAQEASEICPDLVKELGSEENRYKGIPMEALIMKLIGAVSELKTELDQMKIT